jgi:hypothetical protein
LAPSVFPLGVLLFTYAARPGAGAVFSFLALRQPRRGDVALDGGSVASPFQFPGTSGRCAWKASAVFVSDVKASTAE